MPILKSLATFAATAGLATGTTWKLYTRNTTFVPGFSASSPDFSSPLLRKHNPSSNPPLCVDHAIRKVPLEKLKTDDVETLTKEFCAGVWSGWGFAVQRKMLEKEGRGKEGREKHLWEREEFRKSDYEVGTVVADHFEVVERGPGKVAVRCGDTPLNRGLRPSDGIFSMEVTKDDKEATFHMKSFFFNSTPEGAATKPTDMPWWFDMLHKEYAKLWMETSVRKLMK
ncbi:hypothetical protein K490DRAFT_70901 [Saccharata proteae CBS 121410]|uniref:Uncharacterized protein n=1 Tax=Saccharata proteae CBS 121410 TaxID=1314787 RepID=A0A9P4I3F0_9PEZI|nr:hypothetical protein K490DRAFT_70901 [Saccharata proteae CBS 121410]